MDLIYTNNEMIDQGVLDKYAFDLSFGEKENDFEITVGEDNPLQTGAFIYIEGTEYGGIIDGLKATTAGQSIAYTGRTWHGMLNSKVIEPDGDYLTVSGDAHEVLMQLLNRIGVSSLFGASGEICDIQITSYKFPRYCKAYDGIREMLRKHGAKLKIERTDNAVVLSADRIIDYSEETVDGYSAVLSVEVYDKKVNHMICLGKGELSARTVIHIYVDQYGNYVDEKHYSGIDEVVDVYDNPNAESEDELRQGGIDKLDELRGIDKAEISVSESIDHQYDIGDIVGATERKTGITVTKAVAQKIVRIKNGAISVEYQARG